jgi:hypothetical protein
MTMTTNPLLEELHSVRERLLVDAGGTLDALVDRLQAEEQHSDHPRYQPRQTDRTDPAAKPDELAVESPASPPDER